MSRLAAIGPLGQQTAVQAKPDAFMQLTQEKRDAAFIRYRVICPAIKKIDNGARAKAAAKWLHVMLSTNGLPADQVELAATLGRKGKPPSLATLERWIADYRKQGVLGLASGKNGRDRSEWGWEVRAQRLWLTEQRRNIGDVAWQLQQEGHETATYQRVRRYVQSLPATLGEDSPRRVGRHHYNQNIGAYINRDESVLPVGFVYQGDGHLLKWYTAHHNSGNPVRYEFTPWIDVRSKYVVGWSLSRSEAARSTLFGLSHALLQHDHVPAVVHTDPGPGFHNRMLADESETGFMGRMSIYHMVALPGNAKGKAIERWFRTFTSRCGKQFQTFCGNDAGPDALNRMTARIAKGEIHLPSYQETYEAIARYIEQWNNTYLEKIGCRPCELWAELKRTPVITEAAALCRPREVRMVRRCQVSLFNRVYKNREVLRDYHGAQVIVEFDLHNADLVWIYNAEGRFLCNAELTHAKPWLEENRMLDLERASAEGRIKRLDQKKAEIEAQGRAPIDHHAQVDAIESLHQQPSGLVLDMENPLDRQAQEIELDTFDTDY